MSVFKAFVTDKLAVSWLKPVVGVPLLEGRIGEDRVFGAALTEGRYLVWATEATISKAVKGSPKGAYAKLAHEARAEGADVPAVLASVSGCSSEQGVWSNTKMEQSAGSSAPTLASDRTVGLTSDGPGAAPKEIKAKPKEG